MAWLRLPHGPRRGDEKQWRAAGPRIDKWLARPTLTLGSPEPGPGIAQAHLARVGAAGCASHPHLLGLVEGSGAHAGRDLADAVHLLCALHGRHPGFVALACNQSSDPASRSWLTQAAEDFEHERLYLVRLTSTVGPMPSTPGAAQTEAGLQAQRHALEMLASSERLGCALGAATALVGDWGSIRQLLDRAAERAGIDFSPAALPNPAAIAQVVDAVAVSASVSRALSFGADQLLLQHRALFDLLEARASARADW